jgi:CubicO group peptidase (beta-lactamase class C family)
MVARHGKITMHEAIGWRHRGYRLPMQHDTLFRMASNTKPVVATAVLILSEEGKLDIKDRVARHLDSFSEGKSAEINLFQLLTHSSGFRIAPIFYPFEPDQPATLRSAAAKFAKEGPAVPPGTSYSYSNAGFNTLGAVIEQVSGMPLEQFFISRIYAPLGMLDTLHHEDGEKLHRMATVYRGSRGKDGRVTFRQGFTPDDPPDYPVIRASGGMISTAMDYARFLQMYLNGGRYGSVRILAPESVKLATQPHIRMEGAGSYGLGWSVSPEGIYSHGGSDGTFAWVDPGRDLIAMVLTQSPGGNNPIEDFQKRIVEACRAEQ